MLDVKRSTLNAQRSTLAVHHSLALLVSRWGETPSSPVPAFRHSTFRVPCSTFCGERTLGGLNRSQLSTLKVGSNIQRQAKVDSTVGTMKGRSIDARTMRLPRKCRFSRSASHIPSVSLKSVAQKV